MTVPTGLITSTIGSYGTVAQEIELLNHNIQLN